MKLLPQSLTKLKALLYLSFSDTGLCAPANADFQKWLSVLHHWEGEVCTAGGSE